MGLPDFFCLVDFNIIILLLLLTFFIVIAYGFLHRASQRSFWLNCVDNFLVDNYEQGIEKILLIFCAMATQNKNIVIVGKVFADWPIEDSCIKYGLWPDKHKNRAWVTGCAVGRPTGESMILVQEARIERGPMQKVRIFRFQELLNRFPVQG